MADGDVIEKAFSEERILVTNDKDFGNHVYRQRRPHSGVILLRLQDERPTQKIDALKRLLGRYADRLAGAFMVVTDTRIRVARA
jgi:predicted nuclease of predicted toxin-antitoxin system